MDINFKHKLKDQVWVVTLDRNSKRSCGFCGGVGMLSGLDSRIERCPICHGEKTEIIHEFMRAVPAEVIEVNIELTMLGVSIDYTLQRDKEQYYRTSDSMFLLQVDAEANAEELQKALDKEK